jgi:hypothetical protein
VAVLTLGKLHSLSNSNSYLVYSLVYTPVAT